MQNRVWGYTDTQTHGGVIDDNVTFDDEGNLILIVNGDKYVGDKEGIVNQNGTPISVTGGQRTGACIVSSQTYGPGSFEVVMKIPSFNGICTSMWLFNYIATEEGAPNHNYEIDIEIHGTTSGNIGNLRTPLFTSWLTEGIEHQSEYKTAPTMLADGQFHTYRIDWHTGDNPYVEYYIDGVLLCTQNTYIPANEMYLNIGCWLPNGWCGDPNFETDYAVVKSFTYTPFEGETASKENCEQHEAGGFLDNVEIPEKNFIACGGFDYDFRNSNNVWAVTDDSATVANGSITFDGTLTQTVTMDCLGNKYCLNIEGNGNAAITVTYQSIVDGVEVSGKATGTMGQPLIFTTPDNCTQLLIQIVSDGQVTLSNVNLNYANA